MLTRHDVLLMLGELAAAFAQLEYWVGELLCYLVAGDKVLTGLLVTRAFSLRRKLDLINDLARLRYWRAPERQRKVEQLTSRIKQIIKMRNLFIHGIWTLRPPDLRSDTIRVVDRDAKAASAENTWNAVRETCYSASEFRKTKETVLEVIGDSIELYREITGSQAPGEDVSA